MDCKGIFNYIRLSKRKSVSIEKKLLSQYPGIVRDVAIIADKRVRISFFDINITSNDESEVIFYLYFANNEELLHSLEDFCSCPISDWHNYNDEYIVFPSFCSKSLLSNSWLAFKRDFADRKIKFPSGHTKFVIPDPYWQALWDKQLKPDASFEEVALWAKKKLSTS